MAMWAWALVIVVLAALAWAVAVRNQLRQLRNRVDNAYGQIDVQLKRRHDLVPNLVEVARGYMAHEAQTLEAVTRARGQAAQAAAAARAHPGQPAAMGAVAVAEQQLGGQLGQFWGLAEAYPTLKADARMQSLSEELSSTENRIGFARQAYNDQVLEYNDLASDFPALVVARPLGFAHLQMLETISRPEERQAPAVRF